MVLIQWLATVQLTSKLTLACGEHACVLQFLSCLESKHACDTKWAARESTFVYLTRAIFRVLHASNVSCAAHESMFLCAAYKLTAVFCQRRIEAYNKKALHKT